MMLKNIIYFLITTIVYATTIEETFINEINRFRQDPVSYLQINHFMSECSELIPVRPLMFDDRLQKSSSFHSMTLSFNNCTEISHYTCPLYCDQFNGNCGYDARIFYFYRERYYNPQEILIKGPKKAIKFMKYFLLSEGHCDIMLNPYLNRVGCSFHDNDKNIFVCDFIYKN